MSARSLMEVFVDAFAAATAKVISEKAPSPWTVAPDDKQKPAAGAQVLTVQVIAEPYKAEAALQMGVEGAATLAGIVMGTPVAANQLKSEHVQAVRNVLAKACESAIGQLQVPGLQVQVQLVKGIAWAPAKQFAIAVTDGTLKIPLQFLFTADWPKAAQAVSRAEASAPRPTAAAEATKGIDVAVLENVELDVTLRFGQRQLTLRQIGELRSGSVIELDKYIQDPAELLLGDRVIARGEVVIVDGNYGLRVTEIP